jgi:hypothetical protein
MIIIIRNRILGMLIAILDDSCSKRPKAEQEKPNIHDVMHQAEVRPEAVFSVHREGRSTRMQINIDFSDCRHIEIFRNTTGIHKKGCKARTIAIASETTCGCFARHQCLPAIIPKDR